MSNHFYVVIYVIVYFFKSPQNNVLDFNPAGHEFVCVCLN